MRGDGGWLGDGPGVGGFPLLVPTCFGGVELVLGDEAGADGARLR